MALFPCPGKSPYWRRMSSKPTLSTTSVSPSKCPTDSPRKVGLGRAECFPLSLMKRVMLLFSI